ncbi:hypothetical protein ABZ926_27960 [Streptomyces litmocidini]
MTNDEQDREAAEAVAARWRRLLEDEATSSTPRRSERRTRSLARGSCSRA